MYIIVKIRHDNDFHPHYSIGEGSFRLPEIINFVKSVATHISNYYGEVFYDETGDDEINIKSLEEHLEQQYIRVHSYNTDNESYMIVNLKYSDGEIERFVPSDEEKILGLVSKARRELIIKQRENNIKQIIG